MVEHKRSSAPKRRGYYVRMKLKHGTCRPHHQDNKTITSTCFYTYYKILLFLSLTLYFSSSYFIPNNNHNHSKPSLLQTSLFQSSNTTTIAASLKSLKVFLYDLPSTFNTDWLVNHRCTRHLFAAEVAIHRALLTSHFRTFDPYEADFFFVPLYVSCNFSTVNGFPAIGHARRLISSAVKLISSDFPFWNRSQGRDHVFVASHDFASCFHTLEDVAIADGVPGIMKNSIVLQTFGVTYDHPCQEVENVVIPPYVSPESVRSTLDRFPVDGRRDIWAFFRGKMEVHPKNVSGRFYSK